MKNSHTTVAIIAALTIGIMLGTWSMHTAAAQDVRKIQQYCVTTKMVSADSVVREAGTEGWMLVTSASSPNTLLLCFQRPL